MENVSTPLKAAAGATADKESGGQIRGTNGDVKERMNLCLCLCVLRSAGHWEPQQEK